MSEQKRRPGNPKILEASAKTRWPAVAPGETMKSLGVRLPQSLVDKLEALEGTKSEHIRAALEEYLKHMG